MPSADRLSVIQSEGRRIAAAARRDPGREVPQYPGWSLADLASHTGSIHGRTVIVCREHPTERVSAPRLPEGADPIDWYEANLEEMLAALSEAADVTGVWSFDGSGTLDFWERRMLIETGVHRWDAEQAFGPPDALHDLVASEGLEEYGPMWHPSLGVVQALRAVVTDLGGTWQWGPGEATAEIEGPASEIYLRLMSRPSSVKLPDDWTAAVDGLSPPPKR